MTLENVKFTASASTIKSSDIYMTIIATLFTSPSPNLNGVCCTEQFIDDIVNNEDDYVGVPLYCDVNNLEKGKFDHLGHMYNSETDEFGSQMIGSFYHYEKVVHENGEVALIGYARVAKRNKDIRDAIMNLFAENKLKFSFEISVGSCSQQEDGTILIDKADRNFLEGMAIVSNPACPDAVALDLVAEALDLVAEVKVEEVGEMNETANVNETVNEVENNVEIVAAEEKVEKVEKVETAETSAEQTKEVVVEEVAECSKPEEDDEEKKDEKEEETAEVEEKEDPEEKKEDETEEASCKKKCAEEMIAELFETVSALTKEIESLKLAAETSSKAIAEIKEAKKVIAEVNPFTTEINAETEKYKLLESEKTTFTKYSLLD